MNINAYLNRVGYQGDLMPNLETLTALHQAHLMTIPYENLDIHLGRTLTLDEHAIFEKIVTRRRGGWCFEMNGLFAWALRELGYDVTMLGSAVNRETQGESHLILLVQLEQPYLTDVGFANGILHPLPLRAGHYQQSIFEYALANEEDHWYFTNHAYGGPGFDFTLQPRTLASFAERCHVLQTAPESGFVQRTVCFRFLPEGLVGLRGAILRTITADGVQEITIADEAAYHQTLVDQFDLHLPDADITRLWRVKIRPTFS